MPTEPARDTDRVLRDAEGATPVAEAREAADTPGTVSDVSLPGPRVGLTDRDRSILALESRTFRYVGAKERAIREEVGVSKVAYYVRLNALLDDPAALRAAPSVVNRLRARRTSEDGPAAARDADRVA
ncbi:DUF3263 domain-containing protein [Brachybacterium sp. FME24]|uniref:DUF3263 domain-containing protein n=1 Tax=Brachybacterium sp. FME24 TaxID=2742605 RepID=UPI001867488B|nr:DUF3263 domain-containing protein [Brachybacterium sp. FME24]